MKITTRYETEVEFISASGDFESGDILVRSKRLSDGKIYEYPIYEYRTEGGLSSLIAEAKKVRV
jgi:hypothetical protein